MKSPIYPAPTGQAALAAAPAGGADEISAVALRRPARGQDRPGVWLNCAPPRPGAGPPRAGTKTARFLVLVTRQHGPLAQIPLGAVAKISAAVAPEAGLNAGAARAALRRAVLAAQNGDR